MANYDPAAALAEILAPKNARAQPIADLAFHQGYVQSWDQENNTNTIIIGGSPITDVAVMSSGAIMIGAGDVVGLLRVRTQYFVIGRISSVGQALGIRSASVLDGSFTVSGTYSDLSGSPGPTLTDVFIGSSRRCLVFLSASLSATDEGYVACHFQVTGASSIDPPTGTGAFNYGLMTGSTVAGVGSDPTQVGTGASRMFLVTAADGLNTGLNTFTMKYLGVNDSGTTPTNNDCFVENRVITVMPL